MLSLATGIYPQRVGPADPDESPLRHPTQHRPLIHLSTMALRHFLTMTDFSAAELRGVVNAAIKLKQVSAGTLCAVRFEAWG